MRKRIVLWIVGEPGAGKTAIARELLEAGSGLIREGRVKWTVGRGVCAAGHYTGGAFDGADTVPYDGARPCLDYWTAALYSKGLTVLDGDRFSNANALAFFADKGVARACVHVTCASAAARRAERSADVQDPTWVKGRESKARNFYDRFPGARLQLESNDTPAALADKVRGFLASL